jgi:hypothetical protein
MNRGNEKAREPSARVLPLTSKGEQYLNEHAARRIGAVLEDRRLVTEEGCATIAHALDDLANSKMGKVAALCALGDEALRVLREMESPSNSVTSRWPRKPREEAP